ncbi:MAG: sporulation initiation factor Spo0A C-terminal domain-containing protein, partial [Clostridia bacterium]|nr:sporulation initiation factor Spo0A C-terminal domain-containing protein [Clostridia bacterium]
AALLSALHEQERSAPPLTLLWGGVSPWADVCLPAWNINVGLFLESLALCLPRLYPWEKGLERARYFLSGIGLGPHLKGYRYLVWMTAAALGNPALLNAVTLTLYPRAAQAFHTSAAAVERCVRHAIEALWSHGDLNTLEAYFGQTVDPERGKPTNREFLAMAREHCRF